MSVMLQWCCGGGLWLKCDSTNLASPPTLPTLSSPVIFLVRFSMPPLSPCPHRLQGLSGWIEGAFLCLAQSEGTMMLVEKTGEGDIEDSCHARAALPIPVQYCPMPSHSQPGAVNTRVLQAEVGFVGLSNELDGSESVGVLRKARMDTLVSSSQAVWLWPTGI